ncbi:hypothetical protein, partial [Methylobacterium sp. WL8]|uniref:hypothetical protein n=1 Tax=Methylobacterium sp. WL8 TaxID=2603899 RepID=UPI00164F288D
RNPSNLAILDDAEWLNLRMCGDWIFYLSVIRGGLVGYTSSTTNFYRQHANNTSVNTHDKDIYYKEHATVAHYIARMYNVSDRALHKNEAVLYKHWCLKRGNNSQVEFEKLFDLNVIINAKSLRQTNVAIAAYAMVSGGGETFPILIAN